MLQNIAFLLCLVAAVLAHDEHYDQRPIEGPHQGLWYTAFDRIPGDGGTQADSVFSGISTFGRLPYFPCLASDQQKYDIAFIGSTKVSIGERKRTEVVFQVHRSIPGHRTDQVLALDLLELDKVLDVSTYSSRKVRFSGGYNVPLDTNPFNSWAKVLDCGDIPVTSYDNAYAIQQIEQGHHKLLTRTPFTNAHSRGPSKTGATLPRLITLGGDHTITLPLLRSVVAAYGPISVIHFDSHLDTWRPRVFGGAPTTQASINHGTYFYHAHAEGLLANDSSIHAGIRTTLSGLSDYENDGYCGFEIVEAREIDTIGVRGIVEKLRKRVGVERPVYLSIDIDTLDPA
ncbi:MAG: hypothetical protein Q9216_005999, partial [Gyalolechia sp. 2 TL-2023]